MYETRLTPDALVQDLVYGSYSCVRDALHGPDAITRNIAHSADLLAALKMRPEDYPSATVTGSKGKGSTAAFLASFLAASGERVGMITSPHLRSFNERIRIDGLAVSDEELYVAALEICAAVYAIRSRIPSPGYLGPGGVILALALNIFAKHNVTALVLEAGRGGEFDEMRVARANVSVVSPVMLEHPDKLGSTLQEIAETKARITSPGGIIVTAPQSPEAFSVIKRVASELGSRLRAVNTDIVVERTSILSDGMSCDLTIGNFELRDFRISLSGAHQVTNAATAVLAADTLQAHGAKCTIEGIYTGALRLAWPGRAQVLQHDPWVFLDGAINAESAHYACDIAMRQPSRRSIAVVAVPKPKDLDGVCREVAEVATTIITTEVPTPSLTWYEDASRIASKYSSDVRHVPVVADAFKNSLNTARSGDKILLLGTQSFVGAALDFWDVDTSRLW